jgi:hypothetical protein
MKALNTLYKGNYFRSRTEARWAVYFDALGVEWEYEKQGYDLGDGVMYLPDFWFPKHNMFGEVKGDENISDVEMDKMRRLVIQSQKDMCVFVGKPLKTIITRITPLYDNPKDVNISYPDHEHDMGDLPFRDIVMGRKYESGIYTCDSCLRNYEPFKSALLKAQMARFEHGAQP